MPSHPSSLAPGMFGTLRADNLRTWRWEEPVPNTIVPPQGPVSGTAKEGGLGTGGFGCCQGSEISCACSALLSDDVGPSVGSKEPGGGGSHSELVK